MKIAVYTAIFGGKDELKEADEFNSSLEVDYFVISDNSSLKTNYYQLVFKPIKYLDVTLNARYYKIFGLDLFKNYDYVIWHDASLKLHGNKIEDLICQLKTNAIATFRHPLRSNYFTEAVACIKLEKDNCLKIFTQVLVYFLKGVPKNRGLFETSILVKNNSFDTIKFCDLWWNQLKNHSRRDQLGLIYALWKCNFTISVLSGSRDENVFSDFYPHNYKNYISPKTLCDRINTYRVKWICIKAINKLSEFAH